jgi:RHO1 GDP-GTP exchange protein 1/2
MGTIEWEGTAERVAFHAPYVLLFDSRFIEIRHVETGRLAQIISGSDVRCIWDGRGVSTSAAPSSHDNVSQEAQVHVVMNATDSTNGPGALKNKSIMQHVCQLVPTVQLFPSDTSSTTGTGQDGTVTPSNTSYVVAPQGASPSAYAPSANSGFTSPGSVYTTSYVTSPSSPASYAPSSNVYPSSNNHVYPNTFGAMQGYSNAPNQYDYPQSQSSIDLSSHSGGSGGRGGGNLGYFPATSQPPELHSRSWRPS